MLHFQNQNGLIINAQRKDAQRTLTNLTTSTSSRKPRMKINLLSLLLLASATAFCAGGCAYYNASQKVAATQPSSVIVKEDNNNPNPDFIEKIDDIISNSDPEEPKVTEDEINKALDDENTNEEIGDSLQQTATDAALQKLGEAIKNNDKEAISAAIEDLKKELQDLSGEELANKFQQIADEIREALKESPMKDEDPTRKALEDLANTFEELAKDVREDRDEDNHQEANDALDKASDELQKSADEEEANKTAAEEAKEKLENQGQSQGDEDQGQSQGDGNQGQSQGDEDQGQSGDSTTKTGSSSQGSASGSGSGAGAGNGDTVYRGKDHVYTKDGGEQEYGNIIDESHNSAIEDDRKTNDNDTTDDDDFSDLLDKYYDYLYDDTQKP